ncbi:MAG: YdgA family protein, partial [Desulfuromonadales bacterium]|nr:YdgA family protein [Desulfuromonadales bacterium]
MVVDLAADLRSGQGRFDMPSLRFSGDGIVLEVAGASSRFSSSEERGLTVGQYHTTLESFRFELDREPKYASVALKGLDMASRNGITGGFYGGMVQLQADRMRLGKADYGPLE